MAYPTKPSSVNTALLITKEAVNEINNNQRKIVRRPIQTDNLTALPCSPDQSEINNKDRKNEINSTPDQNQKPALSFADALKKHQTNATRLVPCRAEN